MIDETSSEATLLTMKNDFERITRDPAQMNGQACIRGMRLTVKRVLELVALYPDRKELFREYPDLEPADLEQALAYAAASLDDRFVGLEQV